MSNPVTIAVDAMGGNSGPAAVVEAVGSLSREDGDEEVFFLLVGDESEIGRLLVETRHNPERISVVHADESGSGDRVRGDASDTVVRTVCELVGSGDADAVVTAGHAGAAVLAAHDAFELIPGVERAALATVYPTWEADGGERFCLMLDVGATLHAEAEHLVAFALMGSAYARIVADRAEPRIGLLSVSPDPRRGPPEVVEAHDRLLQVDGIDFGGAVEGHQIPHGGYDVIVCEGFVGDVAIKVLEGFAEAAFELAENAYERKFSYRMGLRLLSPGLQKIKRAVDFEEYGGAPLLGFDRVVILADPRSGARALANAIRLAAKNARADLPRQIESILT